MGFLRTDYANTGFGALPAGEYECIISEAKLKTSSNGNEMISVMLTVREDVEQAGQKRKIFDNLMLMDTMMWKIQQVSKAVGVEEGTDFETPADFIDYIQYKAVRVKTKIDKDQNGEDQTRIATYLPATFEGSTVGGSIDITDEDLPF